MGSGSARPGAHTVAVTGVVAVVSVVVLAALWAASLGPDAVVTGGGPVRGTLSPLAPSCRPSNGSAGSGDPAAATLPPCPSGAATPSDIADAEPTPPLILLLAALILVAVAILLALAVVWAARRARRALVAVAAPDRRDDHDDSDPRDPLGREAARAVPEAERLLATGSPRNAVVACWARLEAVTAEAGVRREPWETSEEFGHRLLVSAGADRSAAAELAGLFREARYSTHDLTEDHRRRAVEALAVIARDVASGPRTGASQ